MYENNNVNNTTDQPEEEAARTPFDEFVFHQKRALEETGKALDALVPPGFKEHGAEAGREFAKGFKVLVDAAITELEKMSKEMDKTEDSDRPSSTGPTKVKVQVD